MYCDWMDGVPLLVEGCYEHNIREMRIAQKYHEEQGNIDIAKSYEEEIIKERNKKQEEESLTYLGKVIKKLCIKN